MNEPLVIVAGTDNNYAIPLAVTLCSAISNLKNQLQIHIFIIDGGINRVNQQKIDKSLKAENIQVTWAKPNDAKLGKMLISQHITLASYYRLLIPEILPPQYNKAIYLDSDLVVTGDIEELWNIDITDQYLLAVQDMHTTHVSSREGIKKYQELGLPSDAKYFNSGVLSINVDKWRTDNISDRCIEYIEKYKEYVRLHDQEALNVVLCNQWIELDPKWNQQFHIFSYSSWQESPFTKEVYNNIIQKPYIIHYTSKYAKPWNLGCTHPRKSLYFDYIDKTAYSGWRMDLFRRLRLKIKEEISKKYA
jgi:lipopolysaccharide biosynthesis glycosyltransferase